MTATPNVQRVINTVTRAFPGRRITFQTYNRRRINNKPWNRWSQHAGNEPEKGYYGNAVDIFDPNDNYNSELLDQIYYYLVAHADQLRIRTLLWRVENHHDHIHCDTWPMMKDNRWYRPPPRGRLVTIEEDGSRNNTFDTELEDDMAFLPLRKGDGIGVNVQKRADVAAIQGMLNRAYDAGLETDGAYGDLTAEAIRDRWTTESGNAFIGNMYDDLVWDIAVRAAGNGPKPKPHRHKLANVEGHTGYDID